MLFHAVSRGGGRLDRARALTNLGNALDAGFRWVEAYDKWLEAMEADPSNRVSTLSVARMLLRRVAFHGHGEALHRVAGYYARLAARGHESIRDSAGPEGAEAARKLPRTVEPRRSAGLSHARGFARRGGKARITRAPKPASSRAARASSRKRKSSLSLIAAPP